LLIDEVSMLSCRFLFQISEQLSLVKGSPAAFGGFNIILAGDFAQLPPVMDMRPFTHIKSTIKTSTTVRQCMIFGKLLWLSFQSVVLLYRPQRQSGNRNCSFVELLDHLCEGHCMVADYCLLQSRLSTSERYLLDPRWSNASIIVSDNMCKDALNKKLAVVRAHELGRELHWYYSVDKHDGKLITDPDLLACLQ
jgi:hypothetical protein